MKIQILSFAMAVALLGAGCSSQPKETTSEPTPAATEPAAAPAPAPATDSAQSDLQACEGKGARDACSYTLDKTEVKGTCVRSSDYSLHCLPKKPKKK